METTEKRPGFYTAMREYFGYRPGTGLKEFGAEMKELTAADKQEFCAGLRKLGIDCEDPS